MPIWIVGQKLEKFLDPVVNYPLASKSRFNSLINGFKRIPRPVHISMRSINRKRDTIFFCLDPLSQFVPPVPLCPLYHGVARTVANFSIFFPLFFGLWSLLPLL